LWGALPLRPCVIRVGCCCLCRGLDLTLILVAFASLDLGILRVVNVLLYNGIKG
jgi:hypothetical protein